MAKRRLQQFRQRVTAPCLNCGEMLDGASAFEAERHRPRPGNITICAYCGHLMAFADDMTFRPLTDEEIVEMAGDPKMLLYQKVTGKLRDRKRGK